MTADTRLGSDNHHCTISFVDFESSGKKEKSADFCEETKSAAAAPASLRCVGSPCGLRSNAQVLNKPN